MNASQLKDLYQRANPQGHFFDRSTLKFFGDSMRNFGVRKVRVKRDPQYSPDPDMPGEADAWCLYRKRGTKSGLGQFFFSLQGRQLNGVIECQSNG